MASKRTCLIIGATTGIGKETAEYLAKKSWTVIVTGRNQEKGNKVGPGNNPDVVENITKDGGSASFYPVDVTCHESIAALHNHVLNTYGRLDAAVNNAGMSSTFMPFHVTPLDDLDFMYNVNQKGTFLCMQEQVKMMLNQEKQGDACKRGVIVNMASMSGLIGVPYAAPYSSTKHAIIGLTKSTALEYASEGIHISAVAPGVIDSGMPVLEESYNGGAYSREQAAAMHPMNRLGTCADVAKAVEFLLENDFITGGVISVDGGITAR
ncbi:short chain dehydrogenase [Aureobasidium sp. EXF-8845]|nr:short chain dehydrogenase [Aureobasidium sp. EXF-8845]